MKAEDSGALWSKLAAPLPSGSISWRQDGRPVQREGKHYARFVPYVEANTVRARLDEVVAGEWDLTLEALPPITEGESVTISFRARLQILGVIREDVGQGRDYKAAATDSFKRAAQRFGIGNELAEMTQNWVQVDGDGRFARPLEDPQTSYDRRAARKARQVRGGTGGSPRTPERAEVASAAPERRTERAAPPAPGEPLTKGAVRWGMADPGDTPEVVRQRIGDTRTCLYLYPWGEGQTWARPCCPECGGEMWDNRTEKRNPKAPDYKCKEWGCDGLWWTDQFQVAFARGASIPSLAVQVDDREWKTIEPEDATSPQEVLPLGGASAEREIEDIISDEDDDLPF